MGCLMGLKGYLIHASCPEYYTVNFPNQDVAYSEKSGFNELIRLISMND